MKDFEMSEDFKASAIKIENEVSIKDEPLESYDEYLSYEIDSDNVVLRQQDQNCFGKIKIEDKPADLASMDYVPDTDTNLDSDFSQIQESENQKMTNKRLSIRSKKISESIVVNRNLKSSNELSEDEGNEQRKTVEGIPGSSHHSDKMFEEFLCTLCDYKTNVRSRLKRHSLIHSKTKLFKCSECDYECNQNGRLKIHLLKHSNTKLFKCSECDYGCNRKADLKVHILTHSSIKLFNCSECDYGCNQKRYLIFHLLIHLNINTKLFKCSECNYGCNYKSHLKRHILTHSKKEMKGKLKVKKS